MLIPNRRQIFLAFSILILLGMSASFAIGPEKGENPVDLADSIDERGTHTSTNDLGFSPDSIYTNMSVAGGSYNSCALLENMSIICWGANWFGQLADGTTNNSNSPIHAIIPANETPIEIAAGTSTACALMESGDVYCWGSGAYGKMGNGEPYNGWSEWVNTEMQLVSLPVGLSALSVSIAHDHVCSIVDNGDIYCWGRGEDGQLGQGSISNRNLPVRVDMPTQSPAISISAGDFSTCAITRDGMAYCWGKNDDGQLGNGSTSIRETTPVEVLFPSGRTPVSISIGETHACALMDNGKVMCWGSNDDGRLGRGPLGGDQTSPIYVSMGSGETANLLAVGYRSACMILDSGETKCWGNNEKAQIGTGSATPTTHPVPTEVAGNHDFVGLSFGGDVVCAVRDDAQIYCWGENNNGQAGQGTSGNIQLSPSTIDYSPNHAYLDDRDADDDGTWSIFDDFPVGCIAGSWYNSTHGDCQWASPGYYTDQAELDHQIPCAVGAYQPSSGQTECLLSPAGHYTDVEASDSATPCPAGQHQPSVGQTDCLDNTPGHFSLAGAPDQTPCFLGTYQPDPGQTECLDAEAGYFVEEVGSASQTPCAAGSYNPTIRAYVCTNASLGHYVPTEGATTQVECAAGTFADVTGLAECKDANPGHFVGGIGASGEVRCPLGQYQPASGQADCLTTDPGHYTDRAGLTEQIACEIGYYQSESGADRCKTSKPGYFVDQTGATEQTPCEAGTFQSHFVRTECIESAEGYYVPEPASSSQTRCPVGNYTDSRGSVECTLASPGFYINNEGSTAQTACGNGTFQPESGQFACLFAEEGHYVDQEGASAQTPCPPGTYQNLVGMLSCIDADPGHHTPEAGMTEQVICPAGTYQPDAGQGECRAADKGHYVLISGMTEQTICGPGWYQSATGQTECLRAQPGHFAAGEGSAEQTPCAVGTYQDGSGETECKTAQIDHYVATTGASTQTPCEEGSSQPLEGQSECVWPPNTGGSLPIIPLVGAAVVLLAIVGFVLTRRGGQVESEAEETYDYAEEDYDYEEEETGWGRPEEPHEYQGE